MPLAFFLLNNLVLGQALMEFLINERGDCDATQMYWDDGWTEIVKKTR